MNSFAMPKRSPYTWLLRSELLRIKESGVMDLLNMKYLESDTNCDVRNLSHSSRNSNQVGKDTLLQGERNVTLSMTKLVSVFAVLSAGACAALLCLAVEKLHSLSGLRRFAPIKRGPRDIWVTMTPPEGEGEDDPYQSALKRVSFRFEGKSSRYFDPSSVILLGDLGGEWGTGKLSPVTWRSS